MTWDVSSEPRRPKPHMSHDFLISKPRDVLVSEVNASLDLAFADFRQHVFAAVRKLAGSPGETLPGTTFGLPGLTEEETSHSTSPRSSKKAPADVWSDLSHKLPSHLPQVVADNTCPTSSVRNAAYAEEINSVDTEFSDLFAKQITSQSRDSDGLPTVRVVSKQSIAGRKSSIASSIADLRKEMEWQRQNSRAASFKQGLTAFGVLASHVNKVVKNMSAVRIEPKDLYLDELAISRKGPGSHWNQLSIQDQAHIIREELTTRIFLVHPQSDGMKIWDMVTMLCLVFTALICPYEIAFLDASYDALYFVNHAIDVIFFVDMVLQFFLKLQVTTRRGKIWLRSRRKIASTYLRSWFIVDLLSILPYDDITNLISDFQGSDTKGGLEHLKVMRLLRILRLFKLARMLRASRLAKRWENRVGLPSSTRFLMKALLMILVSIHWMSCLWGFIGMMEGSNLKCRRYMEANSPLAAEPDGVVWYVDSQNGKFNDPSAWGGQSWVVAFALGRASSNPINPCSHLAVYLISVYWAIMTMTSIGYGDILPQVLSEYLLCCVCMMFGGILWAYVIGAASAVMSNMYPEATEFEHKMDAFNSMVQDMQVPQKIRLRGRQYIRECRFKDQYTRNLQAIQCLGHDLQADISKQKAQIHLGKVGLFSTSSSLFCGDCAAVMEPHFFEEREVINLKGELCIVERGAVGHAGRVFVPWNHWGEDFIIANSLLWNQTAAVPLNYVMVVSLSSSNVMRVLVNHPNESAHFHRAALRMAFLAAVRIYRAEIRTGTTQQDHLWIHRLMDNEPPVYESAPVVWGSEAGCASVSRKSWNNSMGLRSLQEYKTTPLPERPEVHAIRDQLYKAPPDVSKNGDDLHEPYELSVPVVTHSPQPRALQFNPKAPFTPRDKIAKLVTPKGKSQWSASKRPEEKVPT